MQKQLWNTARQKHEKYQISQLVTAIIPDEMKEIANTLPQSVEFLPYCHDGGPRDGIVTIANNLTPLRLSNFPPGSDPFFRLPRGECQ